MAYSIFITAHGGRGSGTSKGTYVVPPGVSIYAFTDDSVLLKGGAGMAIEDRLTTPGLNVSTVRNSASKVYGAFDIIPNYTAYGSHGGDPAFQFDTGAYYVGTAKNSAPALALNDGEQMRLGDIIGAFRKKFPGMTDVYWLCCRAAPQNANSTHCVSVDAFGITEKPNPMGLRPSEVVAKGGQWR
jgi:hypothetical protein